MASKSLIRRSEMVMDFSYTKHQTPRGARPDAEVGDNFYIIKNVSCLRLIYQIRVLAFIANTRGKNLIIQLPKGAKVHESLRLFVRESFGSVKVERA